MFFLEFITTIDDDLYDFPDYYFSQSFLRGMEMDGCRLASLM
jgi:hypothetical protein